jgi:hypothetical protein
MISGRSDYNFSPLQLPVGNQSQLLAGRAKDDPEERKMPRRNEH